MGNWRTVQIVGNCGNQDLSALRDALNPGKNYENFHCLVNGGICGLPNWATENIDVVGNLAECDCDWDDVAEQLKELSEVAPSLVVDVHCGGDYESVICEKTVRLHTSGKVEILNAQKEKIPELDPAQIQSNIMAQLLGNR